MGFDDPFDDPFFDKCKNIPSGVCQNFHQLIGFNNIWIGYLLLVVICLILSALYALFISSKFTGLNYIIKWHVGIFLVNITIWFWIPILISRLFCQLNVFCGFESIFLAIPLLLASFILMILDMRFSPEAKYFRNQKQSEETSAFLTRMKAASPAIAVEVDCYHYETRKRINSNMNSSRTVERSTFKERRAFPIDGFVDETQVPSKMENQGITLFHISTSITAADPYSENAFNQFKNRYVAANSHRDQAMHTNIELSVPGFVEADTKIIGNMRSAGTRIMTVNGSPPWWANTSVFYCMSCLNASILLRILFRTRSTRFSILLQKKYYVDPNIQRSYDFDTGLVGPTVVNNFIMQPQQGYGQPQQFPPGSFVPSQQFQPTGVPAGYAPSQQFQAVPSGYVPVPQQFGQAGFAGYSQEKQPSVQPKADQDPAPPPYNPNWK